MAIEYFSTVEELDTIIARGYDISRDQTEADRIDMLCNCRFNGPLVEMAGYNPFEPAYRERVLQAYLAFSRKTTYAPVKDELIAFDVKERARRPSIYKMGGTLAMGQFIEVFGQIMQVLNLPQGARVLEFGPGDGQISLALARSGCDVTVIDIEQNYLDAITLQAKMIDVKINCIRGEFSYPYDLGEFDAVLFFETFHHCLDQAALLARVWSILKPGGKVVFSGEPILEPGNYWRDTVPYPWGLRMDGLSLCAVRDFGWMELGFQEEYFYALLERTGFSVKKVTSSNPRGTCYVGHR